MASVVSGPIVTDRKCHEVVHPEFEELVHARTSANRTCNVAANKGEPSLGVFDSQFPEASIVRCLEFGNSPPRA